MGMYLNPGSLAFERARNSEIYVDKTGLIACTNEVLNTEQNCLCVSRPRRFGKTMGMNMLAAYYDCTVDGAAIFQGLKIAEDENFSRYANKFNVVRINMLEFLGSSALSIEDGLRSFQEELIFDILEEYPDFRYRDKTNLRRVMWDVFRYSKKQFVILLDEWDCPFRERQKDTEGQKQYLDFLRDWLKNQDYVALAYMTGILPAKKYGKHSALNMFVEYSMEDPWKLAEYVGFTADEVKALCERFQLDYQSMTNWYDGYSFPLAGEVYSPWSVVQACKRGRVGNYWNKTESYEALKIYISMNFDGLKEIILRLMIGERQRINTGSFVNDMTTFSCVDDVLTLLIHLGYLGYDIDRQEVFIPNNEIRTEFANSVQTMDDMSVVARAIKASDDLLDATLRLDAERVAEGIEAAHLETSLLQYNDENALSYTVGLAYYTAKRKYNIVREMPMGRGFADLVFIPRPNHTDLPAMVVELKWDETADTAIAQIKKRNYDGALKDYSGKILLVGISYNPDSKAEDYKKHRCVIEEM